MSNETRRILLVEDEKAIRDAVTAYLERENYWVTAVGDGQDALEEFQKHHFDLVILEKPLSIFSFSASSVMGWVTSLPWAAKRLLRAVAAAPW